MEERNEVRRERRAEEWVEICALTQYKSALPNLLQISPRSSRHQVSAVSHSAPNTVWCWEWGLGDSGEEIGTLTLFMRTLPNLSPISPVSKVSAVSHSTQTKMVVGNGTQCRKKRVGRGGRVGRDWAPNPIYLHPAQSHPNIAPRFPVSKVSVVLYSAPNKVWCWGWGLGRSGKEWEEWGRVEK